MDDQQVKLQRDEYTVAEVAYILGVTTRTVRSYFTKESDKRPGEPMLTAEKRGTIWYIKRDNFEKYLEEVYGAARTE